MSKAAPQGGDPRWRHLYADYAKERPSPSRARTRSTALAGNAGTGTIPLRTRPPTSIFDPRPGEESRDERRAREREGGSRTERVSIVRYIGAVFLSLLALLFRAADWFAVGVLWLFSFGGQRPRGRRRRRDDSD